MSASALVNAVRSLEVTDIWGAISLLERRKMARHPEWAPACSHLLKQALTTEIRIYSFLSLQRAQDEAVTPESRFMPLLDILRSHESEAKNFLLNLYVRHLLKYCAPVEVLRVADQLDVELFKLGPRATRVLIRMLVLSGDFSRGEWLYEKKIKGKHSVSQALLSLAFAGSRNVDLSQKYLGTSRWQLFSSGVNLGVFPPGGVVQRYEEVLHAHDRQWEPVFEHYSKNDEVLMQIGQAVRLGKPLSFVRLGEGEGYFFSLEDHHRTYFERHWWGSDVSPEIRNELVEKGRQAVNSADLLGVPSQFRLFASAKSKSPHSAGLREVMDYVSQGGGADKLLTNTEYFWLVDKEKFKDQVVRPARKIVVISDKTLQEIQRFPIFEGISAPLTALNVPSHAQNLVREQAENPAGNNCQRILALDRELRLICGPKVLVLVSSGIAGKHLCHVAKTGGAVAVDVGAALQNLGQMREGWGL